mmetsp:Transcript_18062/g.33502  ORF Transcript_18062/g.33502 Transcript_18062/m.33502 type:complete len:90 (-) Transcript_18062:1246-1515(-)
MMSGDGDVKPLALEMAGDDLIAGTRLELSHISLHSSYVLVASFATLNAEKRELYATLSAGIPSFFMVSNSSIAFFGLGLRDCPQAAGGE